MTPRKFLTQKLEQSPQHPRGETSVCRHDLTSQSSSLHFCTGRGRTWNWQSFVVAVLSIKKKKGDSTNLIWLPSTELDKHKWHLSAAVQQEVTVITHLSFLSNNLQQCVWWIQFNMQTSIFSLSLLPFFFFCHCCDSQDSSLYFMLFCAFLSGTTAAFSPTAVSVASVWRQGHHLQASTLLHVTTDTKVSKGGGSIFHLDSLTGASLWEWLLISDSLSYHVLMMASHAWWRLDTRCSVNITDWN